MDYWENSYLERREVVPWGGQSTGRLTDGAVFGISERIYVRLPAQDPTCNK